jgi:hypothetical protein
MRVKSTWLLTAIMIFMGSIPRVYGQIDLTDAKVVVTVSNKEELGRAVDVLVEEVASRTSLRMPLGAKTAKGSRLIVCLEEDILSLDPEFRKTYLSLPSIQKEGYKLFSDKHNRSVILVGKDKRGLLYAVGKFLRKAELEPNRIRFPDNFALATSPKYPVRGHQLGYRPKTNSYDAFTVEQFDQYIRDLTLFGANSIEIMPPRTDDDFTSVHMKIPAIQMAKEQSRISNSYGLDVWMWYPNLEKDYHDPETIKKELKAREDVFKVMPKLDAVFAPGGDPGDLEPDELFEWMDKVATVLNRYHPNAKIWISPQSFRPDNAWFDAFFVQLKKGYPWLGGIVFGPWVKLTLEEIKSRMPAGIPIRNYPDITHSFACQYPVPDWDKAWGVTLGREAINPRPIDQKLFHNVVAPYCVGSISYSEGTNDDVNKFIWSDQDWDPATDVRETLEDYSRLFFGPKFASRGASAFFALEENNRGDLIGKQSIKQTLREWQSMEREAGASLLSNARFQMGLIRAYFDEYTRERLIYETHLRHRAVEILETAGENDLAAAIPKAISVLERAWKAPIRQDLRQKCMELADSLFKSIGAQLTVDKHGAMAGRGNFIDHIQYPLNDGPWLISELKKIQELKDVKAQSKGVNSLINWTDPGPGGFYDHLPLMQSRSRILSDFSWEEDPESLKSPRTGFGLSVPDNSWFTTIEGVAVKVPLVPLAWSNQMEALYDTPLKIKYDQLDPKGKYRLRVAYTGRFKSNMRLHTGEGHLIHDYVKVGGQPIHEFDVPMEATSKGEMELVWTCKDAERGVQVSEIWLLRVDK